MSVAVHAFTTVPIRDDLRVNRQNGDVILEADGKRFAAHGVVLSSQSIVFAQAIEHGYRDAQGRSKGRGQAPVVITTFAAQTLRLLLDLIYHEKVSAPIETVFDVLLAADRYKIQHILDCTASTLRDNMNLPVAISVMNVYHGTSNESLTELLCTALDCICDPFNYYELTNEKKQGNPLHRHIMLLSYDAVKMIIERQVMAENKSEFVFASCQLVNVWAGKMSQEERVSSVTELLKVMDIQSLTATQLAYVIRLSVFMDNHQTQGYLMKTITKLLVQLEITKAHRDFKHVNAQEFRQKIDRTRLGGDLDRARSMPHQLDDNSMSIPIPVARSQLDLYPSRSRRESDVESRRSNVSKRSKSSRKFKKPTSEKEEDYMNMQQAFDNSPASRI